MPIVSSIQEFQQCVDFIGLTNIQSEGSLFNWSRRGHGYLAKKLDRTLVNEKWLGYFS